MSISRQDNRGRTSARTRHALFMTAAAAGCLLGTLALAQAGPAGRWAQSSTGEELVLRPKIKLTPYAAAGYGTNLGGSVGYGSATTTVVATEPTRVRVEREMVLTIAPDGGFTWSIKMREAESPSCTRTVAQERRGRAAVAGSELVLTISGGRETFETSCGGRGESRMPAATERYGLRLRGGELVLSSGPITWRFLRL